MQWEFVKEKKDVWEKQELAVEKELTKRRMRGKLTLCLCFFVVFVPWNCNKIIKYKPKKCTFLKLFSFSISILILIC